MGRASFKAKRDTPAPKPVAEQPKPNGSATVQKHDGRANLRANPKPNKTADLKGGVKRWYA